MPLYEFLVKNRDSILPAGKDPKLDRQGCRKRGYVVAHFLSPHQWGNLEGLPTFVVIKCDLQEYDIAAYEDLRKAWRDILDYEVTSQSAAQGWYDVRVFETAASPSGVNAITGDKATKIQGYLSRWGCINIVVGTNQVDFRFRLSAAVQSQEFWDLTAEQLAAISFTINSYTNGVGTITVTVPQETNPATVKSKITERGGTLTNEAHPAYTFTIERGTILQNFRSDIKRKAEEVYMMQRDRINEATMDAAVAAGGTLTLTRAELIAAIRNMQAE